MKRIVFELAIKMALRVHFQYNEEDQAGSGCVILCTAILV